MIRDPLVDWLKSYKGGGSNRNVLNGYDAFVNHLQEQGNEFEAAIMTHIRDHNLIRVEHVSDKFTEEGCSKTIEYMRQGVPLIHSAPLKTSDNTGGIADILIRSDYISQLVTVPPITLEEEIIPAPVLGGDYHYLVIDIKFSTLPLRADGRFLLNAGSYPAYKAQTYIYNRAIGEIQGYVPRYAFILGRRWRYKSKDIKYNENSCLDRLGLIDFEGVDEKYKVESQDAVNWVRDVRENGDEWSVSPPSRPELFPNMCVDSGGQWNAEKEKIASAIKDITTIWNCSIKHRNTAISKGVDSWDNKKCTSETLGMRGTRALIVDAILDINRQDKDLVRPKKIETNLHSWREKGSEVFIDFETLSDIFSDFSKLPKQEPIDMIFMIGVGWEEEGEWVQKTLTCNSASREEEYRIMNEFAEMMQDMDNPRMFFWNADKRFWKTAENRQFDLVQTNRKKQKQIDIKWALSEWCDLCELFQKEPIVIKGCFKFGLKPIANALRMHGKISARIESNCDSGKKAMIDAWKCYEENNDPVNSDVMKDITLYNRFDCQALWEILSYLRKEHA
jgi:hypothetical protein